MAAKHPKIVIIGCGISGISAALRLVKAGFHHVRILEATANSGGRIKTARLGNTITEIGATYIHGPSEENPVFCLARDYGLLDPQALTPENQAMDVDEYPPWVPNWFSSSGQRLSAECMNPALEMFFELLDDTYQSENHKESASVGHFIRSRARLQAAEKWKDKDETTRQLLLCAISTLLKGECCASATPSMDEIDLAGFSMYKNLKGVDCTFPRLVLYHYRHIHAYVLMTVNTCQTVQENGCAQTSLPLIYSDAPLRQDSAFITLLDARNQLRDDDLENFSCSLGNYILLLPLCKVRTSVVVLYYRTVN